MNPDFPAIVQHFRFDGDFLSADRIDTGHINDTYAASFRLRTGTVRRYLLQRINHTVFPSPASVMSNIDAITAHIRHKILVAGGDPDRETVNLVPTTTGGNAHHSAEDGWWRAELFIEGAQTYETVPTLRGVYQVARAYGRFQATLSDFPAAGLHETIPDFHNTPKRYEALIDAVERDVCNRASSAGTEIEFVTQRADQVSLLIDLLEAGLLPLRVTHNDTKFNNVMLDDETGEGICVIDLDTVMPGLSLYDFGDMVRSGATLAAEDEQDLSRVSLELDRFEQIVSGYLDGAQPHLTTLETDYLPLSARLMTLECGIRFLTDYLNGDVYFRIHHPSQNLDRSRTQFTLVAEMERCFESLLKIVERYRPDRSWNPGSDFV